jgi:hypothetical protein
MHELQSAGALLLNATDPDLRLSARAAASS